MRNKLLRGISASPGIVMAKAIIYSSVEGAKVEVSKLIKAPEMKSEKRKPKSTPHDYLGEVNKFKSALEEARNELELIRNDFMKRTDAYHARILDAQLLVIEDKTLVNSTINKITKENLKAEYAFKKAVSEMLFGFDKIKDTYIKARVTDIKDVTNRILRHLTVETVHELPLLQGEKHIVIAQDLNPSDAAKFNKEVISGFATDLGGSTSHTAIMARALGIPAVVGLKNVTKFAKSGEEVIIDGNRGVVMVEPNESTRRVYEDKIRRFQQYEKELLSLISLPCETLDGHIVELACNIEIPDEVSLALSYGADTVGLMRSEFIYLKSDMLPTEYEQYEIYKSIAHKVNSIAIRTLDLGGDQLPSLLCRKIGRENTLAIPMLEKNPALGWRGIRFSLARRDIFISQLKAIIRANNRRNIKILLPMVQDLEEIVLAKACVKEVSDELIKSGIPYGENIEIGVMIEVPSAAIIAPAIAKEVDFLSIGSNDLVQYTLACDRTNPMVAQNYNPLHPAVLKLIKYTIEASHEARKWVELCGELASYPLAIPILIGLGIDGLSVAPIYLLEVKKIIRSLSMSEAKKIARGVSRLDNAKAIKKYVDSIKNRFPVIKEIMQEREGSSK